MDVRLLERAMNRRDLAVKIENQNVTIKLNFHEKKIGLREESNLAILIEVEENHRKRKKVKNETNMEIRKNHILAIETSEVEVDLVATAEVEVENSVTNLLEINPLETEVAEVETSMVTNLLETKEEGEDEGVEAETEMVETITEAETLEINLAQVKNSMVIRKVLEKNENPKIRANETTNANLSNYSKV